MKLFPFRTCYRLLALALLIAALSGCATAKVDWASRVGTYTYDQAVQELGPPERQAKLNDGSTVAEWMTHRGYTYAYSPWSYGPYYYPSYISTYTSPDYFIRLTFGSDNRLRAWKRVNR